MDEPDKTDDTVQVLDDPRRPTGQRSPSSRPAPQPGGFVLESRRAPEHPAREERQPYVSLADAAAQTVELETHHASPSPDTAPPKQTEDKSWIATVDGEIAFWLKAEARYKNALEQASSLDAPDMLLEVCAQGRSVAASGLILALASHTCLARPSPENRKALIDMRPNILTVDHAVAGFLGLPADRLAEHVLDYLDAYRNDFAAQAIEILPAIERNIAENLARSEDKGGPHATRSAADRDRSDGELKRDVPNLGDVNDQGPHSTADADRAAGPEPEFDWRSAAYDAARRLLGEAQSAYRGVEQEIPLSEQEQAEAMHEQTDARRERQACDFQRAAREVVSMITRPNQRERGDDDGGREL